MFVPSRVDTVTHSPKWSRHLGYHCSSFNADATQGGTHGTQIKDEPASDKHGRQQRDTGGARAPKKEWQTVKVEESVDTKVKRWRQVLQVPQISKSFTPRRLLLQVKIRDSL